MAVVKHNFQSNLPDGADASLLGPGHWNSDHNVTLEHSDREGLGLAEADTPTFAALIILDNLGNKWKITATEDGNLSLEALPLP